jgi:formate hydrogenlyase subunit 6/NADH:ubiquinone oxidoreductase subunit I
MKISHLLSSITKMILRYRRYLTRKNAPFKSVVEKYPDRISGKAADDMFSNYRGYLNNDLKKCNGCAVCVPVCPVRALSLDSTSRTDGTIAVSEFRIDLGKCFACGACIDICPESSLYFSHEFERTGKNPEDLVVALKGANVEATKDITRIRTYEVRR